MDKDKRFVWTALSVMFSSPSNRLWEVMRNYDSAELLYQDIKNGQCAFISDREAARMQAFTDNQVYAVQKLCDRRGIMILCYDDEAYPERLRHIYCPPAVLYCRGDVTSLSSKRSVAVIGARHASDYSMKVAYSYAGVLAKNGVTIISGLANGIDAQAHKAAVDAGGITCGVIGCGHEYDYPRGSAQLKGSICRQGCVISEYMPNTRPEPENFKVRNRLIAALSDIVLVVQAGERSGTLNTVGHALEQGKEVLVIPPHDILCDDYTGQSRLIEDGAVPVYSPAQIIERL